jgi:hypothetical protein
LRQKLLGRTKRTTYNRINKLRTRNEKLIRLLTSSLAQAGQWLARKFVRIWKFCARPNGSGSPACAKPLERCLQCAGDTRAEKPIAEKSGGKNENNKTKWQIFIVNGAETSIQAFRLW